MSWKPRRGDDDDDDRADEDVDDNADMLLWQEAEDDRSL